MTAAEQLPLIKAKGKGDRLSENLYKWVKRHGRISRIEVGFAQRSFIDGKPVEYNSAETQSGQILIGFFDEQGEFWGRRLGRILGSGSKAELGVYGKQWHIIPLPEWWQGYIKGGKCWIDPEHRLYHDMERWQISEDGNTRSCLWCGEHVQHKHIEMVPREYWRSDVLR